MGGIESKKVGIPSYKTVNGDLVTYVDIDKILCVDFITNPEEKMDTLLNTGLAEPDPEFDENK